LGEAKGGRLVVIDGDKDLINVSLGRMRDVWTNVIEKIVL